MEDPCWPDLSDEYYDHIHNVDGQINSKQKKRKGEVGGGGGGQNYSQRFL